jgi:hypothetical protein
MVVGTARSLFKSKGLHGCLWGEVVATTVYLPNRFAIKSVTGETPFEAW